VSKSKTEFIGDLFKQQATPLYKFLLSRFRDQEDAAEIAQEAWLRLYRLEDPTSLDNPKAFLFQTASNLAIDRVRRAKLEARFQEHERAGGSEADQPSAERSVSAKQSLALIGESLNELPIKCRQAFLMHRSRDMTYPEIAKALGVSTSMVEKYIIQALKHFRARLGPAGE